MSSPLGQYAPLAATGAALAIIGVTLLALLFGQQLGVPEASLSDLKFLAAIAAGAVFGSAVSVNGWKQPMTAFGNKLDTHTGQIAALGTVVAEAHPVSAPVVAEIIEPVT